MNITAYLFSTRAWLAAGLAVLSLALFSCAPGTGGTGTGPIVSVAPPTTVGSGTVTIARSADLSTTATLAFTTAVDPGTITSTPMVSVTVNPNNSAAPPAPSPVSCGGNTLSLTATGIRYQQACSVFVYQGAWDFGAALTVEVDGQLSSTSSPQTAAVPARLRLVANQTLNSPGVRITATLLDASRKEILPPQVLTPTN